MTWGRVSQELAAMAEIYGRSLTDASAVILLSDLRRHEPAAVLEALARCRNDLRYFPTPAEIAARIPGTVSDESLAIAAAARVVEAISRFGPYRHEEAKDWIGSLGWEVVKRQGGWQEVCSVVGVDSPTGVYQSQYAKLARAVIEQARAGGVDRAPELPESTSKQVADLARGALKELPNLRTGPKEGPKHGQ